MRSLFGLCRKADAAKRKQSDRVMKNKDIRVVALGEVLWDLLPEGPRLGGAPANFATHAAQFGLDAQVVSAVGDDEWGHKALTLLHEHELDRSIAVVSGHPTGTVGVNLDTAGVPTYDIRPNAAWDFIPWSAALDELAHHTDAVCFGTLALRSPLSRQTILRFLDTMPKDGKRLRVFDVNLRPPHWTADALAEGLKRCDILKLNDEELPLVAASAGHPLTNESPAETARHLVEHYGLRALILTCGAVDSHIFTPTEESHLATPHVEVADTVGAGDSFTAAFVASLLLGRTVTEAHRTAVHTAAYVCTQHGATPTLPEYILQSQSLSEK